MKPSYSLTTSVVSTSSAPKSIINIHPNLPFPIQPNSQKPSHIFISLSLSNLFSYQLFIYLLQITMAKNVAPQSPFEKNSLTSIDQLALAKRCSHGIFIFMLAFSSLLTNLLLIVYINSSWLYINLQYDGV